MIDIKSKITLNQKQLEEILSEYIKTNSKFIQDNFEFNVERDYNSFYGSSDYVFKDITINVKLKD